MKPQDQEELELVEAFEKGKLKKTKNFRKEMEQAKEAAANYLRKDSRINIRLSGSDLSLLKRRAIQEGMPYQTLIASVLHKYVSGTL